MTPPIVKRYLLAVDRYRWVIPVGFILGMGVAGAVASRPEPAPTFNAKAVLAANKPPVTFSTTVADVNQSVENLTPEDLLTEQVVQNTAKETGVDARAIRRDTTIKKVKIDLTGGGGSSGRRSTGPTIYHFTIDYRDADSKRSSQVVQELVKQIIDQSRVKNSSQLREVIKSIDNRLPQIRNELITAEQRLEQYDRREGPALLAAQNGSLISGITGAQQQQRQFQLQLQGINAQIGSLQDKLGLNPDQAYVSAALSADPIIANLRTQINQTESQLAVLGRDLRPEHPRMVELLKQQQAYNQLLQQRALEVVGGNGLTTPFRASSVRQESNLDPARQQLANQLVSLQTQRQSLQQQMIAAAQSEQQLRQQYSSIPNKQLERNRLDQQVTLKRALFDKMQSKLVDARAAEAETVSSLMLHRSVAVEASGGGPAKSIPLMLAVGGVVGLLVGGGVVFLLDILEGTFYTPEDLREALRQREVPILGLLPLVKPGELELDSSPVLVEADSPYSESYERLRSNLRLVDGKAIRVILMTSTINEEGKTVSAYNLAIASARAGKRTLLIEADLRSPSHAHLVNVEADQDSQIEPLRYYGQISDCIRLAPEVENLYVVPSAGPQRQAASILESSEIRRLLEDVRGRFDLVVLDSPSLSQCNDAFLLEPFTDGMVLVTRPGYTKESLLSEAVDQLTESDDVRLLGAVINGVEIQLPEPRRPIAALQGSTPVEGLATNRDYEGVETGGRN